MPYPLLAGSTLRLALVAAVLGGCANSSSPDTLSLATSSTGAAKSEVGATRDAAVATQQVAAVSSDRASTASKQAKPAATGVSESKTPVVSTAADGYKVGPLDVLEVTVFKVPDLSKTVQVAEAGSINLPLVGEVAAVGRTAQDIEREVTTKLGAKYLQSPQVGVFVKEFNSQRVTVEGAVKKPGVFPLRGNSTLMQAIALSEGLDDNVASGTVTIFRMKAKGRESLRYDLDEIRSGEKPDPELKVGDMVVVDSSQAKKSFNNLIKVLPAANLVKLF